MPPPTIPNGWATQTPELSASMKTAPMKLSARFWVYNQVQVLAGRKIIMKPTLRRNGYTLIELAVGLIIVCALVIVLYPLYQRDQLNKQRTSCQSNLKQLGLALLQYQQDANGKLPPFASNPVTSSVPPFARPYGWADAAYPYHKSLALLRCPLTQTPRSVDATKNGFTDYWFNTNLSALSDREISQPASTILLGEGNDGRDRTDARYHRNVLTQNWLSDPQSPASRHFGTSNCLFADGHVKSYRPQIFETEDWFSLPRPYK